MASVVVTLRIMPESPEVDLKAIEGEAKKKILSFAGKSEIKVEQVPIAFGLKSLNITFVMDESKGSTEPIEKEVAKISHVNSVEVTDVRRAIG
ncbi:MAG TPA: elongation factor 1-beta [Candidatus Nanoarchaeia archaeon]|nr:elongation factor 1-beta [Candidatus Nanoarchaeia archaeon]